MCIRDSLKSINFLSPSQYGCRKGGSTLMGITDLDSQILNAFSSKNTKLYSSTSTWRMRFPECGNTSSAKYYTQRESKAPYPSSTKLPKKPIIQSPHWWLTPQPQGNGIPQASPLSGTLFLIAINKCANIISPRSEPSSSQMISALTSLPATLNGPKEFYS